jgi:hypothetical protein
LGFPHTDYFLVSGWLLVDGQDLGVGERQDLHHDHAGDAARRIDPEERVVDAAPAQAAGERLPGP